MTLNNKPDKLNTYKKGLFAQSTKENGKKNLPIMHTLHSIPSRICQVFTKRRQLEESIDFTWIYYEMSKKLDL